MIWGEVGSPEAAAPGEPAAAGVRVGGGPVSVGNSGYLQVLTVLTPGQRDRIGAPGQARDQRSFSAECDRLAYLHLVGLAEAFWVASEEKAGFPCRVGSLDRGRFMTRVLRRGVGCVWRVVILVIVCTRCAKGRKRVSKREAPRAR